jgi:hypothetical protein
MTTLPRAGGDSKRKSRPRRDKESMRQRSHFANAASGNRSADFTRTAHPSRVTPLQQFLNGALRAVIYSGNFANAEPSHFGFVFGRLPQPRKDLAFLLTGHPLP